MMKKKVQGYLTVFVCLTLVAMVSLYLLLFEGVRQNTIRLESECITDTGLNSIMAEYHRELYKQYQLLYVDTSYGTEYPSVYLTLAHLKQYLKKNLECDNVKYFPRMYMDPLQLKVKDIKATKVVLATDRGGASLQKQAVEVMKNNLGLEYINQFLNWITIIEENGLLANSVEEKQAELEREQEAIAGDLEESQWIVIEEREPGSKIKKLRRKGVLNLILGSKSLSKTEINGAKYLSNRKEVEGMNQGNASEESKLTVVEKLLFYEYILDYTGRYNSKKEASLLTYQTEYILFGETSDVENLRKVVNRISAIREVANAITLYNDPKKGEAARSAATVISGALLVPELAPVFEASIILGWAYMESLYDVSCLLKGERVELIKESKDWHYSLEEALSGEVKESANKEEEKSGLSYEDYLRILLYLNNLEEITFRLMDVMEMDIRNTPGNESFRMDGCLERLGISVSYQSLFGHEHIVEMDKEY